MDLNAWLEAPGGWLADGDPADVVISSRIRLARNLADAAFPGWSDDEERRRQCARIAAGIGALDGFAGYEALDMASLGELDRQFLVERHLISQEFAGPGAGRFLFFRPDERASVMVNEEDHLRLQVMAPGAKLDELWSEADRLDNALAATFEWAYATPLGFLTACPTNVGTGMRASVMLHLPGLALAGEVEPAMKGCEALNLAVRGMTGEGTTPRGNMFQVSNQSTLGQSECEIIAQLQGVVRDLVQHEQHARQRMIESGRDRVLDYVARSLGILHYAHLLQGAEVLNLVSALRLGLSLGLVTKTDLAALNKIMRLTGPAHLQKMKDSDMEPEARDGERARFVREVLGAAELVSAVPMNG